jgi:hypothetical protein
MNWIALLVFGQIAGWIGPFPADECDSRLVEETARIGEYFVIARAHGATPQYAGREITVGDVSMACMDHMPQREL